MVGGKRTVALVLMAMVVALLAASLAAGAVVHKVGDSAGWTTIGNIDYAKWASTKTFLVGDSLLFEYNTQFHNVKQVSQKDFQSCNATSPIASYTSGSDSITLKRPGHFYFLCGFPGHCQAGQKVDVSVTRSLATVSPSASPTPSSSSSSSSSSSALGSSPANSPSSGMLAPGPAQSSAPSLISSKSNLCLVLSSIIAVYVFGFAMAA